MRPLVLLCSCLLLPGCGALTGLKNIRGSEGDTVSILCTYGEKLRNHQKYWCRKAGILFERCSGTIYARADGRENTEGRVSIQDSPRELRFNVTLRALTLEDSGEYWCGIQMLGFDRSLLVSLVVLPGPRSAPSPTPFVQPLATSLQPKAKAWQTQPTALRTSGPSTHLDSASAKDASLLPSSSSSKSRVCPATVRALAPALVLLALLLVSGLCALGRYILQWRKKVQLATETQRNEKVHHSHLPLGKGQVPEFSVIHMVEATAGPAASPCTDIQCPDQTSEQEEAPVQAPNGDALPGPPLHMSEELRRSVFVSV
ncbi:CMRF35-like molecule 9 isoform X7 [Artibeus jamaicensis]|uniref:CMRF35-like molecule 9 isoform X7 n=1 Tax=Artibeus jamaicensis TaxID=9417 RepID=UPI00235ABDD2|nr:CMRF35-like molecule 9 isoform X7 [Artibeus jamaicensis]